MQQRYTGYDFCGWATKNDVLCSDGRTIRQGAFAHQDGQRVPLIWAHQHDSPEAVLGHGYLEDRPEGVYFYGYLNDTPMGVYSRQCIEHGDITSLSIWANQLKQNGGAVLHGDIKEVSLVLAGANKKAHIDYPFVAHGDDIEESVDEAYIWTGEYGLSLSHADKETDEKQTDEKMEDSMSRVEKDNEEISEKDDLSVSKVLETLNDDQKVAVSVLLQVVKKQMAEDDEDDYDEDDDDDDDDEDNDEIKHSDMEDDEMQYNAFDQQGSAPGYVLSHADETAILTDARACGSFRKALNNFADANELAHDGLAPVSGFGSYEENGNPAAIDTLFPEFHNVKPGAPEVIANDQDWVKAVLNGVWKSPYGKLRTRQVDIRGIEALRAKGYLKGKEKALAGAYDVATRETSSQTVYVKSALNQDDIDDITDFDYVDFQYKIDRMQLEEELARAVLVGDGRDAASPDKIKPDRIRPIWTDDALFTIRKVIKPGNSNGTNSAANFGDSYLYASAVEEAILDAMIDYRGSNGFTMFYNQRFYNKLLLAKDMNGHRLYNNKNDLNAMLNIDRGYRVPLFDNLTRTEGGKTYRLLAILGNLRDYTMGSTTGGKIVHREQFDIDFNQKKSLLEIRTCGTPTVIQSFIVLEEEVSGNPSQG